MKIYIDNRDWWIGYYRGGTHHYACPFPCVVIRWHRNVSYGIGPEGKPIKWPASSRIGESREAFSKRISNESPHIPPNPDTAA
jgi:hypothetical protein